MKNKIKLILYYLSQFILSVTLLALVLTVTLKITILNDDYMIKILAKNNYFEQLTDTISEEMSNYIVQSGLEEEVLKQIYTEEMVKKDMQKIIVSLYNNKDMAIDTKELEKNLNSNISLYLEKKNIKVADQESLDLFVEKMTEVYESELNLSGILNTIQKVITKIVPYINNIIVICIILAIILVLFIKFYLKKITFIVPLMTTGILILIGCYYLINSIDIKNILLYSQEVSQLIIKIFNEITFYLKTTAVTLIIVGLIETVLLKLFNYSK